MLDNLVKGLLNDYLLNSEEVIDGVSLLGLFTSGEARFPGTIHIDCKKLEELLTACLPFGTRIVALSFKNLHVHANWYALNSRSIVVTAEVGDATLEVHDPSSACLKDGSLFGDFWVAQAARQSASEKAEEERHTAPPSEPTLAEQVAGGIFFRVAKLNANITRPGDAHPVVSATVSGISFSPCRLSASAAGWYTATEDLEESSAFVPQLGEVQSAHILLIKSGFVEVIQQETGKGNRIAEASGFSLRIHAKTPADAWDAVCGFTHAVFIPMTLDHVQVDGAETDFLSALTIIRDIIAGEELRKGAKLRASGPRPLGGKKSLQKAGSKQFLNPNGSFATLLDTVASTNMQAMAFQVAGHGTGKARDKSPYTTPPGSGNDMESLGRFGMESPKASRSSKRRTSPNNSGSDIQAMDAAGEDTTRSKRRPSIVHLPDLEVAAPGKANTPASTMSSLIGCFGITVSKIELRLAEGRKTLDVSGSRLQVSWRESAIADLAPLHEGRLGGTVKGSCTKWPGPPEINELCIGLEAVTAMLKDVDGTANLVLNNTDPAAVLVQASSKTFDGLNAWVFGVLAFGGEFKTKGEGLTRVTDLSQKICSAVVFPTIPPLPGEKAASDSNNVACVVECRHCEIEFGKLPFVQQLRVPSLVFRHGPQSAMAAVPPCAPLALLRDPGSLLLRAWWQTWEPEASRNTDRKSGMRPSDYDRKESYLSDYSHNSAGDLSNQALLNEIRSLRESILGFMVDPPARHKRPRPSLIGLPAALSFSLITGVTIYLLYKRR